MAGTPSPTFIPMPALPESEPTGDVVEPVTFGGKPAPSGPGEIPPPPPKRRKAYKQLTPKQRGEIISLWKAGEMTLSQLAKKYDKTPFAISRLLRLSGVKKGEGSAEIVKKAVDLADEKMQSEAEIIAARILETKDESYRFQTTLRKIAAAEIVRARKDGVPLGTILNGMRTIREAAMVGKITTDQIWMILGLDKEKVKDDDLTELSITDLSETDIEQLRNLHRTRNNIPQDVEGALEAVAGDMPDPASLDDDEGEVRT